MNGAFTGFCSIEAIQIKGKTVTLNAIPYTACKPQYYVFQRECYIIPNRESIALLRENIAQLTIVIRSPSTKSSGKSLFLSLLQAVNVLPIQALFYYRVVG